MRNSLPWILARAGSALFLSRRAVLPVARAVRSHAAVSVMPLAASILADETRDQAAGRGLGFGDRFEACSSSSCKPARNHPSGWFHLHESHGLDPRSLHCRRTCSDHASIAGVLADPGIAQEDSISA